MDNGTWDENRKLLLDWKTRDEQFHDDILAKLTDLRLDVAQLKTGARISGAIAGFLAAVIASVVAAFINN